MKTSWITLFKKNRFEFGNQHVRQYVILNVSFYLVSSSFILNQVKVHKTDITLMHSTLYHLNYLESTLNMNY